MTTATQDTRKQDLLAKAEAKFGFLPNVLRQMSTSPAALEVYISGQGSLGAEDNRLSAEQRNLVQLATSHKNDCDYCTAAHKAIGRMQGGDEAALQAVGDGKAITAEQGGDYVEATKLLMEKQGKLDGKDIAQLEAQGIDREVIYEIIANIAIKTVSNWVNHIAGTKVDTQFS